MLREDGLLTGLVNKCEVLKMFSDKLSFRGKSASFKNIEITQNNKHQSQDNSRILNSIQVNDIKFEIWSVLSVRGSV